MYTLTHTPPEGTHLCTCMHTGTPSSTVSAPGHVLSRAQSRAVSPWPRTTTKKTLAEAADGVGAGAHQPSLLKGAPGTWPRFCEEAATISWTRAQLRGPLTVAPLTNGSTEHTACPSTFRYGDKPLREAQCHDGPPFTDGKVAAERGGVVCPRLQLRGRTGVRAQTCWIAGPARPRHKLQRENTPHREVLDKYLWSE